MCVVSFFSLSTVFLYLNTVVDVSLGPQLEKRQHAFSSGALKPTKVYASKTAALAEQQRAADIPEEVIRGPGGFPLAKGPIRIEKDGAEVGLPAGGPPALPPRK